MSRGSSDELTPTSFAMLGLLNLRPWTTYELAKQLSRSIRWFWPRAERKFYDEPKRLASLGLASSRTEMTGRRASTIYEITPAGRDALRAFVTDPTFAPPALEIEGMVHLWFAENATPAQTVASLRALGDQATGALTTLGGEAARIASGGEEFAERRAMNAVTMELYMRLYETIRDWTAWAEDEIATWPPARQGRRSVTAGPPERGIELFASMATRGSAPTAAPVTRGSRRGTP